MQGARGSNYETPFDKLQKVTDNMLNKNATIQKRRGRKLINLQPLGIIW
jgi:hypothetical protein